MAEIRPFTEEFAPAVAALYMRAMRGESRPPSPELIRYFSHILLSNPWVSPDIPSLVCLENGGVVGALTLIPRPMEFHGRKIHAAALTQFMVDPEHRRGTAALQLLRRCFQGPQDLSWSDGSSDPVYLLFGAAGGFPAHFYSLHWIKLLRPFAAARDVLSRRSSRLLYHSAALTAPPADFLAASLPPFRPPQPALSFRPASVEELFSCIQKIGWREPLKPHYEEQSFAWLMSEVAQAKGVGNLRMLLLEDSAAQACGWIVYFAKPAGSASLLQLGTRRRDHFEAALHVLFADAWQQGCALVRGSSRPEHLTTLTTNLCFLRHPGSSALIHSRDPDLVRTVRLGEAALTGLDGERWQRFSSESWL